MDLEELWGVQEVRMGKISSVGLCVSAKHL